MKGLLAGSPDRITASRSALACGVRCCLACGQGSTLTCRASLWTGHRQAESYTALQMPDAGLMEKQTMKKEEAMNIVQQGITALSEALRSGHSETLKRFLATIARFHSYSFGNAILIASQRPDATHVAGFHAWKKLGRFVRKGEGGIAILAPMVARQNKDQSPLRAEGNDPSLIFGFRVAYVFDVSQTEGEPLPEFATAAGEPGEWLGHLEDSIREAGIILEEEVIAGGADGCSHNGRITIRPNLRLNERFAILAHELAHEMLHKHPKRRSETDKTIRETEAEAVAYAVCLACGIDSTTRSADYIQLYRGNEETLRESLSYVQQAAADIISRLRTRWESSKAGTPASLVA